MAKEKNEVARPGKTQRDRENGAKQRNAANKMARVDWQKTAKSAKAFPLDSCNGKRSRSIKRG
jgi:hypothetical protein